MIDGVWEWEWHLVYTEGVKQRRAAGLVSQTDNSMEAS